MRICLYITNLYMECLGCASLPVATNLKKTHVEDVHAMEVVDQLTIFHSKFIWRILRISTHRFLAKNFADLYILILHSWAVTIQNTSTKISEIQQNYRVPNVKLSNIKLYYEKLTANISEIKQKYRGNKFSQLRGPLNKYVKLSETKRNKH